MKGVNKVTLLGTVGSDPEVKNIGERTLTKFRMATNRTYKNRDGEKVTDTQWHSIEAWGPIADSMGKYVKKGKHIYLEGEIRYSEYNDKEGNKRHATSIMAQEFNLLGPFDRTPDSEESAKKDAKAYTEASAPANNANTVTASAADIANDDDDLPF